ncbi:MAG: hypothetical protein WAU36_02290 [Cyclobacteriaceae bacterium]
MKFTLGLGLAIVVLGLGLSSCFDPPEYSNTPEIEFENIVFKETPDLSDADSLILFIKFRDGDGNLGLQPSELGCNEDLSICYNEKFYFKLVEGDQAVNYAVKRANPDLDLPDYTPPFDCTNWELVFDNSSTPQVIDTVYFELNPDHYNIFLDFLVKQNDGSFQEFDWRTEFCSTYDGRFPILAKNSDLSLNNPVEGTLRYAMLSTGFKLQFSIKTLKLRIQIQDRVLNKSNIIETPEFQFK